MRSFTFVQDDTPRKGVCPPTITHERTYYDTQYCCFFTFNILYCSYSKLCNIYQKTKKYTWYGKCVSSCGSVLVCKYIVFNLRL